MLVVVCPKLQVKNWLLFNLKKHGTRLKIGKTAETACLARDNAHAQFKGSDVTRYEIKLGLQL